VAYLYFLKVIIPFLVFVKPHQRAKLFGYKFQHGPCMNDLSFYRCRPALSALSALVIGVAFHPASGNAWECADPKFGSVSKIGGGIDTSLTAHPSGVVLEFHKTENRANHTIWYHVGKRNENSVTWGPSQVSGLGQWPTVTMSKEGYVILVYGNQPYKDGSDLKYRVGKIDPNGDHNQSITWLTESMYYDRGYHGSIAINDSGVIVGVHETGHASDGLYYRVGHLRNPAAGDYGIHWDSGEWGVQYDTGINPHIAINNDNDVVSVHQVPGERLLHYRRGKLEGGRISFGESKRYHDNGSEPAVAFLGNGLIAEVHVSGGTDLYSRIGKFGSSASEITWRDGVRIPTDNSAAYPAVAAAGTYAVQTYQQSRAWFYAEERYYSVAEIYALTDVECYTSNGTLIKGFSDRVYVVLNGHRYWIPDEVSFNAMGYNWADFRTLSDDLLDAIPEKSLFPSVPPLYEPFKHPNGTLVMGTTRNVYVVLNNYRYWIPDEPTFEAMGYQYDKIISLGSEAYELLEGGQFPSVVR
jgi:hypothetical protein